ncbi:hypothetical protein ACFSUK_15965 [Sphingobium scionense]
MRSRERATLISAGNHGHGTAWAASQGLRHVRRIYRISNDIMRNAAGAPSGGLGRLSRTAMARLLARDADHLVLVSPTLADTPAFAGAARAGKVAVIPNGIDADAARFLADGPVPHRWMGRMPPVILAIGGWRRRRISPPCLPPSRSCGGKGRRGSSSWAKAATAPATACGRRRGGWA